MNLEKKNLRNVYLQLQEVSLPNPDNYNLREKLFIKEIRLIELMHTNIHAY